MISQVASAVLGNAWYGHAMFLVVQLATMLILYTGANTPFNGFPFLASFVAEDQFLPQQLTRRGHRLAFSNGIIVLTVVSLALLIGTDAQVDKLVAFYAIGVFTGFTLAGFGMAKYFRTHPDGPQRGKIWLNTASGSVSAVVVLVFAVVKFTEGAWLVLILFPLGVFGLFRLNRQYRLEAETLRVVAPEVGAARISRHSVVVLVDSADLATIAAVRYASSLGSASLRAVHFILDEARADELMAAWSHQAALARVPLDLIHCRDRRLTRAVRELAAQETTNPTTELTFLLPRRTYARFLGRILHDHTADDIARAISQQPRVVATVVPFDVNGLMERRRRNEAAVAQHAAEAARPLPPAHPGHQGRRPLDGGRDDQRPQWQARDRQPGLPARTDRLETARVSTPDRKLLPVNGQPGGWSTPSSTKCPARLGHAPSFVAQRVRESAGRVRGGVRSGDPSGCRTPGLLPRQSAGHSPARDLL